MTNISYKILKKPSVWYNIIITWVSEVNNWVNNKNIFYNIKKIHFYVDYKSIYKKKKEFINIIEQTQHHILFIV